MMTPALKQLLLDHPKFFVDFQEDQIMVYREYTIEPSEYSEGLQLGAAVLAQLPRILPTNKTQSESNAKDADLSVFVSKSEAEKKTA